MLITLLYITIIPMFETSLHHIISNKKYMYIYLFIYLFIIYVRRNTFFCNKLYINIEEK